MVNLPRAMRGAIRRAVKAIKRAYGSMPVNERRLLYGMLAALVPMLGAAVLLTQHSSLRAENKRSVLAQAMEVSVGSIVANRNGIESFDVFRSSAFENVAIVTYWKDGRITKSILPPDSYKTLEQSLLFAGTTPIRFKQSDGEPEAFLSSENKINFSSLLSTTLLSMMTFLVAQHFLFRPKPFRVIQPKDLTVSMDDLVGSKDIKDEVTQLADLWEQRSTFERHGITRTWHVLLTGPAGTGKTKMASALAKRLNVPLLYMDASRLETGLIGGGSRTLDKLSRCANRIGRCVVFLDEGQSLLMQRSTQNSRRHDDATPNALLSILDGVRSRNDKNVIWVIASNFDQHTSSMDEAVLRRFHTKVNFRLPNHLEREALICHFLARRDNSVKESDLDYKTLAAVTSGFSPAHLEMLVDNASLIAIREHTPLSNKILMRAFERTMIGLTDRAQMNDQEDKREIVATHEAGHFLASVLRHAEAGRSLDVARVLEQTQKVSVESVSHMGALGYALRTDHEVPLYTREDLLWQVRGLYGGRAAESVVYGEKLITNGALGDIKSATQILANMVGQLGFAPSGMKKAPIDLTLHRDGSNKPVLSQEEQAYVEIMASQEYEATVSLVDRYRPALDVIRMSLLKHYTLSRDELFTLLAPFWPQEEPAFGAVESALGGRGNRAAHCPALHNPEATGGGCSGKVVMSGFGKVQMSA
ncbi:ATP-dependent zinc metalloprotease FtsH [Cupriavidus laharis]|uniref:ATP-dependent zinc metalloprotease FtsH n=1 Tax=Cupriavidus laharis TaxID=151654 RepID=A0ABN7YGD3_9BURK|nr:ATP-dependent zinc metalloprotease FtsH [Cupriavidus laharis]